MSKGKKTDNPTQAFWATVDKLGIPRENVMGEESGISPSAASSPKDREEGPVSEKTTVKAVALTENATPAYPVKTLGEGGNGKVELYVDLEGNAFTVKSAKEVKKRNHVFLKNEALIGEYAGVYTSHKHFKDTEGKRHYVYIGEYYDAIDLAQVLASTDAKHQINLTLMTQIFANIAKQVQHLHDGNFVHQDIKPENILLLKDKSGNLTGEVKLIDFGCAHPVDTDEIGYVHHTGTPGTHSPERLLQVFYLNVIGNFEEWQSLLNDVQSNDDELDDENRNLLLEILNDAQTYGEDFLSKKTKEMLSKTIEFFNGDLAQINLNNKIASGFQTLTQAIVNDFEKAKQSIGAENIEQEAFAYPPKEIDLYALGKVYQAVYNKWLETSEAKNENTTRDQFRSDLESHIAKGMLHHDRTERPATIGDTVTFFEQNAQQAVHPLAVFAERFKAQKDAGAIQKSGKFWQSKASQVNVTCMKNQVLAVMKRMPAEESKAYAEKIMATNGQGESVEATIYQLMRHHTNSVSWFFGWAATAKGVHKVATGQKNIDQVKPDKQPKKKASVAV